MQQLYRTFILSKAKTNIYKCFAVGSNVDSKPESTGVSLAARSEICNMGHAETLHSRIYGLLYGSVCVAVCTQVVCSVCEHDLLGSRGVDGVACLPASRQNGAASRKGTYELNMRLWRTLVVHCSVYYAQWNVDMVFNDTELIRRLSVILNIAIFLIAYLFDYYIEICRRSV